MLCIADATAVAGNRNRNAMEKPRPTGAVGRSETWSIDEVKVGYLKTVTQHYMKIADDCG